MDYAYQVKKRVIAGSLVIAAGIVTILMLSILLSDTGDCQYVVQLFNELMERL